MSWMEDKLRMNARFIAILFATTNTANSDSDVSNIQRLLATINTVHSNESLWLSLYTDDYSYKELPTTNLQFCSC